MRSGAISSNQPIRSNGSARSVWAKWSRLLGGVAGLSLVVGAGAAVAGPTLANTAATADRPESIEIALDRGFPDPSFVVEPDGTYHAYATGFSSEGAAYPVATSTGLQEKWDVEPKLAMPTPPGWVGKNQGGQWNLWAPSVYPLRNGDQPDTYGMYFTANHRDRDLRCIGVARSDNPVSDFVGEPNQLKCVDGAQVIDPASYVGKGGQRFVVYKVKSQVGDRTRFEIRVNKTNSAGTRLTSEAKTLISIMDANVEAPDVYFNGERVFMFVARGSFTDCSYRTEVWSAGSVWNGTWERHSGLMNTEGTNLCGPGGTEVRRVNDRTQIVFHAWKCESDVPDCRPGDLDETRRYRAMYTAKVGWGPDGQSPHVLDR